MRRTLTGGGQGGDIHPVDPETQARLEALLEAAGMGSKLGESKQLTDPEVGVMWLPNTSFWFE